MDAKQTALTFTRKDSMDAAKLEVREALATTDLGPDSDVGTKSNKLKLNLNVPPEQQLEQVPVPPQAQPQLEAQPKYEARSAVAQECPQVEHPSLRGPDDGPRLAAGTTRHHHHPALTRQVYNDMRQSLFGPYRLRMLLKAALGLSIIGILFSFATYKMGFSIFIASIFGIAGSSMGLGENAGCCNEIYDIRKRLNCVSALMITGAVTAFLGVGLAIVSTLMWANETGVPSDSSCYRCGLSPGPYTYVIDRDDSDRDCKYDQWGANCPYDPQDQFEYSFAVFSGFCACVGLAQLVIFSIIAKMSDDIQGKYRTEPFPNPHQGNFYYYYNPGDVGPVVQV